MTDSMDEARRKLLQSVFRMPSAQTMVSRKSSITNAFVSAVIPVMPPTVEEIAEALSILGLDADDLECSYCGNGSTEWDHLRPLVDKRRPTGFVSEIANLVPSCGKCNQSKGNKDWKTWMLSQAKHSPSGRQIADVDLRIERLESFEQWRTPTRVDFVEILGKDQWEHYWSLCEKVVSDLKAHQLVADAMKQTIEVAMGLRRQLDPKINS